MRAASPSSIFEACFAASYSSVSPRSSSRVTLDFDSSVLSRARRAEEATVVYNPKRKGVLSDYPLFAAPSASSATNSCDEPAR